MADEHTVKEVASAVVDDVINGVTTELNKTKDVVCTLGKSKERSLLCVLFDPCKYVSELIVCDDVTVFVDEIFVFHIN